MSLRDQQSALEAARLLSDIGPQLDKELRTQLRSLPTRLHRSGLAATAAFIAAGALKKDAFKKLERLIVDRIKASGLDGGAVIAGLDPSAFAWLGRLDHRDYARLNAEIEDLFGWVKRLSEATRPTTANGAA